MLSAGGAVALVICSRISLRWVRFAVSIQPLSRSLLPPRIAMAIEFKCECGEELQVADEHAGRRVRCPECQRETIAPDRTRSVTSAEPAPAPKASPVKASRDPDLDEPPTRSRKRVEDDEDEDDRPRRRNRSRRDDFDDDDEVERRRRCRSVQSSGYGQGRRAWIPWVWSLSSWER